MGGASVAQRVAQLEKLRNDQEKILFNQATAEMSSITDFVVSELGHELVKHFSLGARGAPASFLASSSKTTLRGQSSSSVDVRLVASDEGFPRVGDLIKDMEHRRDQAESHERSAILNMELKLLEEENAMVKEALSLVFAR